MPERAVPPWCRGSSPGAGLGTGDAFQLVFHRACGARPACNLPAVGGFFFYIRPRGPVSEKDVEHFQITWRVVSYETFVRRTAHNMYTSQRCIFELKYIYIYITHDVQQYHTRY